MITTQDVETLPGTPVLDSDGDKVGDVAQVYVSDDGAEPLFVTVKTGLFGTKETFVPLDSATLVQGALHVRYDKAVIKDAPRVEADDHLSDAEQTDLFDYYDAHPGTQDEVVTGAAYDDGRDTTFAAADTTAAGTDVAAETVPDTATGTGYAADGATGAGYADAAGSTGAAGTTTDADGTRVADATDTAATPAATTGRGTADDGLTLSEERMNVGTQKVERGRAHLRKHIVTEQRTITVPVSHEELRVEREPITDGTAVAGGELAEDDREIVLSEERPVVETEVVPVERVRVGTETVTEQQDVTGQVRHEELDTDGGTAADR